mmetsp:Transcript_18838/g.49762  ORF Transcript_18838/g.49762 Transcript_18838/m.49762 type:complete len:287 (+) Transcript_18838:36-896(+)
MRPSLTIIDTSERTPSPQDKAATERSRRVGDFCPQRENIRRLSGLSGEGRKGGRCAAHHLPRAQNTGREGEEGDFGLLAALANPRHLQLRLRLALVRGHLPHDRHLLLEDPDGVGDLALQPVCGHREVGLDLLPDLRVAEVEVRRAASGAQALLRKLLEALVVAAALVVLQVGRVPVLEGGEALHADLVAHLLALAVAIHVGDQDVLIVLVLLHQLVPRRRQRLAMAAPRGVELDEDGLPSCRLLPSLLREHDAAGPPDHRGREQRPPRRHRSSFARGGGTTRAES